MVFHWSLSDRKSFKTLLSILAVLNNAVVWMVSTRSPTSKSSSPFNNRLVTVLKAPITIGIIVTTSRELFTPAEVEDFSPSFSVSLQIKSILWWGSVSTLPRIFYLSTANFTFLSFFSFFTVPNVTIIMNPI